MCIPKLRQFETKSINNNLGVFLSPDEMDSKNRTYRNILRFINTTSIQTSSFDRQLQKYSNSQIFMSAKKKNRSLG